MLCLLFRSDRKSTRLNSSHLGISYAVFCLKKNEMAPHVGRSYTAFCGQPLRTRFRLVVLSLVCRRIVNSENQADFYYFSLLFFFLSVAATAEPPPFPQPLPFAT